VSASADKTLKIWDARSGQMLSTFSGHDDSVDTCAFSPDGTHIASASADGMLKLWNAESGRELRTFKGAGRTSRCVFSPDGAHVAAAGGELRIWDIKSGRALVKIEGHNSVVNDCAFSSDGRRILSADASTTR
jgi:WD40 repeat protein